MLDWIAIQIQPYLSFDAHLIFQGMLYGGISVAILALVAAFLLKGLDWLKSRPNGKWLASIPPLLLLIVAYANVARIEYLFIFDGVTTEARVLTAEYRCWGSNPDGIGRPSLRRGYCFDYEFEAKNSRGILRKYQAPAFLSVHTIGRYPKNSKVWITYQRIDPSMSRWPPVNSATRVFFYCFILACIGCLGGLLKTLYMVMKKPGS